MSTGEHDPTNSAQDRAFYGNPEHSQLPVPDRPAPPTVCVWREEAGVYATGCGQDWLFWREDIGEWYIPRPPHFRYCPYCGRPIEETAETDDE